MPSSDYEILIKTTVSRKNPSESMPRKKDRPSKMIEVFSYCKPQGKQLKELKRKEAMDRQAVSMAISPTDRLAMLDAAFGVGCGAQRERSRLHRKIEKAKEVAANPVKVEKVNPKTEREIRIEKQKRKEQHDKAKKA